MARNLNPCFSKIRSPPSVPASNRSPPFYVKTYNSLYADYSDGDDHSGSASTPDIATAFASRRFFFSSPGRSNSIIDSSSSSSIASCTSSSSNLLPESEGESVAVEAYSEDPFGDFRRSMQEMVEAREIKDVRENWEYLHQLLMCYLSLNPKSTHKYIVGAFADLLVNLTAAPIGNCRH